MFDNYVYYDIIRYVINILHISIVIHKIHGTIWAPEIFFFQRATMRLEANTFIHKKSS